MKKRDRRVILLAGMTTVLALFSGACVGSGAERAAIEAAAPASGETKGTEDAAAIHIELNQGQDGASGDGQTLVQNGGDSSRTDKGGDSTAGQKENEAENAPAGKYDELLADEEYCRQNQIYKKETSSPDEITMVFAGDILFDESYAVMAAMKSRGQGIAGGISADMLAEMRSADIFMVNNEFPYTNRGTPTPDKSFTFRAKPEYASWLVDMGADIVSLANNHASDYGEVSLTDTIDTLEQLGMPFVGAGRNISEASRPVYFIANDTKIAVISATQIERMPNPATKGATDDSPGVFRCLDLTRLLQVIEEADAACDYVVVYIHWGTESTDVIDHWQKEQAPQIAAAGADLIIGDHPHVLQPIGYCGEVPVVYSLGNFLFNSKTRDTCLVKATLDGNGLKSLQFIPGVQSGCRVSKAGGAEKERILAYMRKISPEIFLDDDGYISKQ